MENHKITSSEGKDITPFMIEVENIQTKLRFWNMAFGRALVQPCDGCIRKMVISKTTKPYIDFKLVTANGYAIASSSFNFKSCKKRKIALVSIGIESDRPEFQFENGSWVEVH